MSQSAYILTDLTGRYWWTSRGMRRIGTVPDGTRLSLFPDRAAADRAARALRAGIGLRARLERIRPGVCR